MEAVPAARRCVGELLPVISTAGLVIALATGSLYFAQLGFLRGLGPGLAVPVLVATLVAATFVPAVLAIAGKAMLWPQRAAARDAPTKHTLGVGGRAVRLAVRHPVIVAAVCGTLLLGAASGLTEIRTANSQMTNLPASSSVNRGYVLASQAFVPGVVAPTTVVLERRGIGDDRPALGKLQRLLSHQPAVAGVIGPGYNPLRNPLGVMVATNRRRRPLSGRLQNRSTGSASDQRGRVDALANARSACQGRARRRASIDRRRFRALRGHRGCHSLGPASGDPDRPCGDLLHARAPRAIRRNAALIAIRLVYNVSTLGRSPCRRRPRRGPRPSKRSPCRRARSQASLIGSTTSSSSLTPPTCGRARRTGPTTPGVARRT